MPGINDEDIQKVREANDLVSVIGDRVPLRQKGRDFWCCCPIHDEKTPSCKIDPAAQLWHCFGCGSGGDVVGFVMQADGLSFPEAVHKLAERVGISVRLIGGAPGPAKGYKARLGEACKETAAFYHLQLMRSRDPLAAAARDYLGKRGFGGEVSKRWQLGFAGGSEALVRHLQKLGFRNQELVDANVALVSRGRLKDRFFNRVIFPICDIQGEVIAFGGRVLDAGTPKYLNSQETPLFHKSEVLFGLDKAKSALASTGAAVVVEGYTDVIALHEAGITNVVATLGTALTSQHIRVLARHARKRIVYLFDGDAAGQRAADKALGFVDESITPEKGRTISILAASLPEGTDPADFVEKDGADALRARIDNARDLVEYGIERRLARYDMDDFTSRGRAVTDALSILAPIKESILAKEYAVKIAGMVPNMKEDVVLAALAKVPPPRVYSAAPSPDDSAPDGQDEDSRPVQLSQAEANRRRFEREFLSLAARHPGLALAHTQALAQTQWHEPAHAAVAEALLDVLVQAPQASAAEVVSAVSVRIPKAAGILTSGTMGGKAGLDVLVRFLAEELGMGDVEDAIAVMKVQLGNPKELSPEDQELLFASVVALQKDLTRRRLDQAAVVERFEIDTGT
ncbi:MAG: DNA primase [Eggerthellaceae bacterium]|jgi:DNA primase|nr:DNA primase [Eggerthellaceae bacterium]MDR2715755.1 DNA primase [Coriobacteriaceae bacterium]